MQTWNLYPAVFVAVFCMFILIFSLFNPANPDVAEQPGDGASVAEVPRRRGAGADHGLGCECKMTMSHYISKNSYGHFALVIEMEFSRVHNHLLRDKGVRERLHHPPLIASVAFLKEVRVSNLSIVLPPSGVGLFVRVVAPTAAFLDSY